MQEKNTVIHLDIIKHLICYFISFMGLSLIYSILFEIASLFPSFKESNFENNAIILQTLAYGLTLVSLVIYLYNIALKDILKQYKQVDNIVKGLLYGAGLILGTMIIGNCFYRIGELLGVSTEVNENEQAIREATLSQPIITAFMTILFAPITEEIGYRFGLFGGIHKYNRFAAYAVTALVFALIHFEFAADNIVNELLNLPSYIFAGVWLCLTYEKSGSIVTSITAHMTNNAVTLILFLIQTTQA